MLLRRVSRTYTRLGNEVNSHFIIIIIIKQDWQCKAGRGRLAPYQSEDYSPKLPTYIGKEEKGKSLKRKKGRATIPTKKPANPIPSKTGSTRSFQRDTER